MDFAKTARNLAVADVALAFARDRLAAQLPRVQPRKRRRGRKALLIGGVATAAAAAVLLKRDKVTALLGGRTDEPAPPEPDYTPPPVSNDDAAGPVTDTAVPVPPAHEEPTIDEAAEEAPLAEDGEGEEQTERESRDEGRGPEQAEIDEPPASEHVEPTNDAEWRTWSGRTSNP